jgi:hypothetical protein
MLTLSYCFAGRSKWNALLTSGDFAKLGSKKAIVQKLKEKAGPEARKLFEKFVRDVEKFQARQERNGG